MKTSMSGLYRFAKCSSLWLLLILTINAHADGMSNTPPPPAPEITPVPVTVPAFNHPKLVLADGRVLVAGGMAISNASVEHTLGATSKLWNPETKQWQDPSSELWDPETAQWQVLSSELWDPETDQWQVLSNDLRFDPDQRVHLNQMSDERVLFFATREDKDKDKAEYQARIWNPKSGTVERLPVNAKPKLGIDIAMLADGRVLIINGSEGSADIWDSSTNTVTHTEEPLLENSRWRALPLKNKQVLLIETFPDDPAEIRRNVTSSVSLLWDPKNGEWQQIADLPAPFRSSSGLAELADGLIQANITEETYQLPSLEQNWEGNTVQSPSNEKASALENDPSKVSKPATDTAAPPALQQEWWAVYSEATGEFKWIILAVLFPVVLYVFLRRIDERKLIPFLNHLYRFQKKAYVVLVLAGVAFCIWGLLYAFYDFRMTGHIESCMTTNPFPIKGKPNALNVMKSEVECLDNKHGFVDGLFFNSTKSRVMSLVAPCRYVGVWSAKRPGSKFKITLTDDNEYVVEQQEGNWGGREIEASWGVHEGEMVWVYSITFPYLPQFDVNRILPKDRSHFTLVDELGVNTEFELIDAIKSNTCTL